VVPEYILNTINSSPDEFFSGYRYSTSQDKFVEDIANERLDGAEISEIVLHYMKLKDPSIVPKIRIIATSPEKPSPVFVVHPSADTEFSYLLTNSLTSMNEQAEGRQILKQMGIDMFVELDHSYYVNESLIS
jgi:phosphonate transport system substrate-binding protein